MIRWLYNIGIFLYGMCIHIGAVANDKAKSWKTGRQFIFAALRLQIKRQDRIIWVHCASYGEFEQGKPLIERIKRQKPDHKVLLTFFSPSGYKHFYNYDKADYIFYLPLDRRHNAKRFLDIVHPQCIFFIKYEYWFNYIHEAYQRHIPFYVVSAIFHPDQYFFKIYGHWFRLQLRKVTYFFVQDEASRQLLLRYRIPQCGVFGDTRFDTVLETVRRTKENNIVRRFCEGRKVLIGGSTWEPDEKLLHEWMKNSDYALILTPHEVNEAHLQSIARLFHDMPCVYYTQTDVNQDFSGIRVMVVDTVGLLKNLYPYAGIAYIGGGFGKGIHNTLEAATFGLPILFGPKYHHFKEACDLIECKGAFCVHNAKECIQTLTALSSDEGLLRQSGENARHYVEQKAGASDKVLRFIERSENSRSERQE